MQSNEIRQHLLKQMNWRYGTKGFDSKKKVAEDDVNTILEAMRLAPSAFGLQPWRFILVESASIRRQMAEAVPANKAKFENASHLIILARLNNLSQEYVDHYFNLVKQVRHQDHAAVKPFYDMISNKGNTTPRDAINMWTAKQVYIALGHGIMASALLNVDTCPMEGINPALFDQMLNLEGTDYSTTVALALGYRSENDPFSQFNKVRFPQERVIQTI